MRDFGSLQQRSKGHLKTKISAKKRLKFFLLRGTFKQISAQKKAENFRGALRAPQTIINFKEKCAILAHSRNVLRGTFKKILAPKEATHFRGALRAPQTIINFKANCAILARSRSALRDTLKK